MDVVRNPAEHTLQFVSKDGKLVDLVGFKGTEAAAEEGEFVIAIYNDPTDLEPTAYAKISPAQLAQIRSPFRGVYQAVGIEPVSSH